jgi:hypothetical protein
MKKGKDGTSYLMEKDSNIIPLPTEGVFIYPYIYYYEKFK